MIRFDGSAFNTSRLPSSGTKLGIEGRYWAFTSAMTTDRGDSNEADLLKTKEVFDGKFSRISSTFGVEVDLCREGKMTRRQLSVVFDGDMHCVLESFEREQCLFEYSVPVSVMLDCCTIPEGTSGTVFGQALLLVDIIIVASSIIILVSIR
mmetsp:Transcript_14514/g.21395  ORF Transcript_14514/g.21395 Transcript_14514/m.21395 type:complete len:151 (+) Transcript_14514:1179-1631(+)